MNTISLKQLKEISYPCRDSRLLTWMGTGRLLLLIAVSFLLHKLVTDGFSFTIVQLALVLVIVLLLAIALVVPSLMMDDIRTIVMILDFLEKDSSPERVIQTWKFLSERRRARMFFCA